MASPYIAIGPWIEIKKREVKSWAGAGKKSWGILLD